MCTWCIFRQFSFFPFCISSLFQDASSFACIFCSIGLEVSFLENRKKPPSFPIAELPQPPQRDIAKKYKIVLPTRAHTPSGFCCCGENCISLCAHQGTFLRKLFFFFFRSNPTPFFFILDEGIIGRWSVEISVICSSSSILVAK